MAADAPQEESDSDATKRRFREALERKKAGAGGGAAPTDAGRKQAKGRGPVENRREFRRKSG